MITCHPQRFARDTLGPIYGLDTEPPRKRIFIFFFLQSWRGGKGDPGWRALALINRRVIPSIFSKCTFCSPIRNKLGHNILHINDQKKVQGESNPLTNFYLLCTNLLLLPFLGREGDESMGDIVKH